MSPKIFSYYLPQFHQIPENDAWWGEGFTEWTNVKKAKPLFPFHNQPLVPGELGYYHLNNVDIMYRQADLAKNYGVDGFVFYHYWFGNGKVLLEKPLHNFLKEKKLDIKFCLCWANESWKGTWHGAGNRMLQEQYYPGSNDYLNHFSYLLPFFKDHRHLMVENCPVFQVYIPESIPDLQVFMDVFETSARKNGFNGIYWIAVKSNPLWIGKDSRFQGMVNSNLSQINKYLTKRVSSLILRLGFNNPWIRGLLKLPKTIEYESVRTCLEDFSNSYNKDFFPLAIPNWDNTPRTKNEGTVYLRATPEAFQNHLYSCLLQASKLPSDRQFVFVKSWNEWAEGNILEPTQKLGKAFLESVRKAKSQFDVV